MLCCNTVVQKKVVKPLKNYFWAQFAEKRVIIDHTLNGKHFLAEITKADH